ncbi:MAG: hypothetical protein WCR95_08970 [Eubacteriales bacterium]
MSKKVRTIAFQVDDWDFLKEYDLRQQESGLSVKNYFINLIKADIAFHQAQAEVPVQEEQDGGIPSVVSEPEQDAERPEQQAEESPVPADLAELPDSEPLPEQADQAEQQNQPDEPAPTEEMMNLFIKIPKDHRIALDAHKNATDETVNKVINRIVDDFLDHTDSLPEGFDEAYQRYSEYPKLCDTTASAKIPARISQELTEYLADFGGSRNALMATLVELELKGQELVETQNEDQGMNMI